ncbi:MAG TPA: DUF2085 domain-containing protein, partial [Anaerolineae bacterium]|nr:DUF2085 domain-containing protein [Anaerolineae bacterium]
APAIDRGVAGLARHWLFLANLAVGMYVGGTLLAPVLMRLGLERAGQIVYTLYSFVCHQLPQRSYFLFGPDGLNTYSREQVIAWGAEPAYLRGFVGNAQVGFKLGIAGRDIAIYVAILLAGLAYALLRRHVRGLPAPVVQAQVSGRAFLLLILPLALDGVSHLVSEISGLGFRESNGWLAALTGNALSELFYTGTTVGSFNWLMRSLTGALFGIAVVWFAYPIAERAFGSAVHQARLAPERAAAAGRKPQTEPPVNQEKTTTSRMAGS